MKSRSTFSSVISVLIPMAVGGLLVYSNLFAVDDNFLKGVVKTPLAGGALGALLIFSVALRFFSGFGRKKELFIDFQSDGGNVGISTSAIQDFIERVGKEFAAVKSIESKLIRGKDGVDIGISVKVLSGNKIPELSQMLQQRIRESVRESLGLEDIREITIKVAEIVGDPAVSEGSHTE